MAPAITPEPTPEQPAVTTGKFVGSVKSDKYHYPSCRHAKNINAQNEIWFANAEDARTQGYTPCGVCKP